MSKACVLVSSNQSQFFITSISYHLIPQTEMDALEMYTDDLDISAFLRNFKFCAPPSLKT